MAGGGSLVIRQRMAQASMTVSSSPAEIASVEERIGTVIGTAFYQRAWAPPIEDTEAAALLRKLTPTQVLPDVTTAHRVVHQSNLGYIASDLLTFENTASEDIAGIVRKLELGGSEPYTHWACAITSGLTGRWNGIVMAGRKLPRFDPSRISGPLAQNFVDACPHCGDVHQLTTLATSRVTKIGCPKCHQNSAFIAKGRDGKYRFLSDFLTSWEGAPLSDLLMGETGPWLAGMIRAVHRTCAYSEDTGGRGTADDIFQTSLETIASGHGDCEDSSILLCDWLTALGFQARVACGSATRDGKTAGHAWVQIELHGNTFILETTGSLTHPDGIVPLVEGAAAYQAEMMFDKDHLYLPIDGNWKAVPRRSGTHRASVDATAVAARLRQLTVDVRPRPTATR